MSNPSSPNPKDDRDILFEAFKIAEGRSAMIPTRAHVKALYDAFTRQIQGQMKIRNAVAKLSVMAREGRLPKFEEIPIMIDYLTRDGKPPPSVAKKEEKD